MRLCWRYGIMLAVTAVALVPAVRKPTVWKWGIVYLLEIDAFCDAYNRFGYYSGLEGSGLLPWLTHLWEEAVSFGAMFSFGILFFVTLSVHVVKHGVTNYSVKFRRRADSDPNF